MAIPFLISQAILTAVNFPAPTVASQSYLCTPPPQSEGLRFVPMQFSFLNNETWLVDLRVGSPNPPLSQICSLYIDTFLCQHELYIYFPDSGYGVTISPNGSTLVPVISGERIPRFYVGVVGDEIFHIDDLPVPNFDVANVFAINQYVPSFESAVARTVTQYNLSDGFNTTPTFTMADIFAGVNPVAGGTGSINMTLINNNRWFIKNLDINIIGNTTDGSAAQFTASLLDGINIIGAKNFLLTAGLSQIQLFDRDELNYASQGGNGLVLNITVGAPGVVSANVSYNIYGGILVV